MKFTIFKEVHYGKLILSTLEKSKIDFETFIGTVVVWKMKSIMSKTLDKF